LVSGESALDRFQQFVPGHRFCKKVFGARLYRLDRRRNVSVGAYEHNGQTAAPFGKTILQLQPIQAIHLQVQQ
ncbi:MAG: hypothetical protein WA760_20880, partial [Pseudolabrys sp.]